MYNSNKMNKGNESQQREKNSEQTRPLPAVPIVCLWLCLFRNDNDRRIRVLCCASHTTCAPSFHSKNIFSSHSTGGAKKTTLAKEGKLPTFFVRKHQPGIILGGIYFGPFPKWTGYTRALAYLNASFAWCSIKFPASKRNTASITQG